MSAYDILLKDATAQLEMNTLGLQDLLKQLSDFELPSSSNQNDNIVFYNQYPNEINEIFTFLLRTTEETPEKLHLISCFFLQVVSVMPFSSIKLNHGPHAENNLLKFQNIVPVSDCVTCYIDTSMKFHQLWLDKLSSSLFQEKCRFINIFQAKQCFWLTCLCQIFDVQDILDAYKKVRRQQIQKLFAQNSVGNNSGTPSHIIFSRTSESMFRMIVDDLEISSICFKNYFSITLEDLKEIYLDPFLCEIEAVIEMCSQTSSNLFDVKSRQHAKSCSTIQECSDVREMILLSHTEEGGSNESILSRSTIEEFIQLIKICFLLERNLLKCLQFSEKDVTIGRDLKKKRKQFKGVLKNSVPLWENTVQMKQLNYSMSCDKLIHLEWDWRSSFVLFSSDMAQLIDEKIHMTVSSILQQECLEIQRHGEIEPFLLNIENNVNNKNPRQIAQSVMSVISTIDKFVVVAMACDGPLQTLRTAFQGSLNQCFLDLYNHLLQLSQEALLLKRCLYLIISSAVFLNHKLNTLRPVLEDEENISYSVPSLSIQLDELIDYLNEDAIQYEKTLISTIILHDRESHNWKSTKPFFENEHISFSIQMWCFHLDGLYQDLFSVLPNQIAEKIFVSILKDNLHCFARRYATVIPSFARVEQFKADITAILTYTSEFLMKIYNSFSYQMTFNLKRDHLVALHSNCFNLLSTMLIVASPLQILYKEFKKGLPNISQQSSEINPELIWLSVVQPHLWPSEMTSDSSSSSSSPIGTSIGRLVKQICSRSAERWPMLLQLLFIKDCALPVTLLNHSLENPIIEENMDYINRNYFHCEKFGCKNSTECLSMINENHFNIQEAIIIILANCHSAPNGLFEVLLPVIKRFDYWNLFCSSQNVVKSLIVPPWYKTFCSVLKPTCIRMLKPVIEDILSEPIIDFTQLSELQDLLSKLPDFQSSRKSSLTKGLENILNHLDEAILNQPLAIQVFFSKLQNNWPSSKGSPSVCIAVQIIANCLFELLTSPNWIEQLTGMKLTEEEILILKLIANQLADLTVNTDQSNSFGTPVINIQKSIEKINQQLGVYVDSENFKANDEAFIMTLISEVSSSAEGYKAVKCFEDFIITNQEWILKNLHVTLTAMDTFKEFPDYVHRIKANLTEQKFNPFQSICYSYNQKTMFEFQYEWSPLLKNIIGKYFNKYSFKLLLSHRWEFQDEAQLSEKELKYVQVLQSL